jgi:hypothetical protein
MLATLMMSLALTAQDPCNSDYESAACAAAQIAEATRTLSLPDIQTEFDGGVQVYRAVFDADSPFSPPAVSFERRLGHSPELVVYGAGGQTVRREIGAQVWEVVQERSRYVGRRLDRREGYSRTCSVSSTAIVQIARPRRLRPNEYLSVEVPPTQASQNSCMGGLTWDYAAFLADLACGEIPACDAMGARDGFGQANRNLEIVFRLHGDRVAAGRLYGTRGGTPWRRHDQPVTGAAFADWLHPEYGATLDWGGSVIRAERLYDDPSPDAISTFLADRDAELGEMRYERAEFGADAADAGWVTGTVSYSVRTGTAWRTYQAPYRQTWLRSSDDWRLWSMTVGTFTLIERAEAD